jgi:hypothetical protein
MICLVVHPLVRLSQILVLDGPSCQGVDSAVYMIRVDTAPVLSGPLEHVHTLTGTKSPETTAGTQV